MIWKRNENLGRKIMYYTKYRSDFDKEHNENLG